MMPWLKNSLWSKGLNWDSAWLQLTVDILSKQPLSYNLVGAYSIRGNVKIACCNGIGRNVTSKCTLSCLKTAQVLISWLSQLLSLCKTLVQPRKTGNVQTWLKICSLECKASTHTNKKSHSLWKHENIVQKCCLQGWTVFDNFRVLGVCQNRHLKQVKLGNLEYSRARTQYKRTGHWRKYKVMLSRLYYSAISKYYSR